LLCSNDVEDNLGGRAAAYITQTDEQYTVWGTGTHGIQQ
jgi:hypothetical protein